MATHDDRGTPSNRLDVDDDAYRDSLRVQSDTDSIARYKRRSDELLDLEPGSRVLDAGCGLGDDVRRIATRVTSEGRVVGLDASPDRIAAARERTDPSPAVDFGVGDIHDIGFVADTFDAARADRVLQHVDEPEAAIDELRRVTRPGGRVAVTDPDWTTFGVDLPEAAILDTSVGPAPNPDLGRRLLGLCVDAGLTDLAVDTYTVTPRDPTLLKNGAALEAWTEALRDRDLATDDEIDALFAAIDEAAADGSLFSSLTGFTVAGTVPADR